MFGIGGKGLMGCADPQFHGLMPPERTHTLMRYEFEGYTGYTAHVIHYIGLNDYQLYGFHVVLEV